MRSAVMPGSALMASARARSSAVGSAIGASSDVDEATSVRRQPHVRLTALAQEKDGRTALGILGIIGGRFDGMTLLAFVPLDTGDLERFLAHFPGWSIPAWDHRTILGTPMARLDLLAPISEDEIISWAAVCDRMTKAGEYRPFGWAGELL